MTYYTLAGHSIAVCGNGLNRIPAFLPFVSTKDADKETPILLQTGVPLTDRNIVPLCFLPFIGDNTSYSFAVSDSTYLLKIERLGIPPAFMEITNYDGCCIIKTNMDEHTPVDVFHYGLLRAFGIALLFNQTTSVHASTVLYEGKAVLFLGDSGTGKSTHVRLWLDNMPHTELLNDDIPLIRVMPDQTVWAFGSPWSGKTVCYKNKSAPIAAIVPLSQAPYNQITQLKGITGFGALLHSCARSLRCDETLLDHITAIFSTVLKQVPVYHLECLPNPEAARLVFNTLQESGIL